MKAFSDLYIALDRSTKTTIKLNALVEYFKQVDDTDRLWTVALLSHRRPKRPVKTSELRLWASELSGIPLWLLEESYHIVGDLAETLAQIIPNDTGRDPRPLHVWISEIITLRTCEPEEKENYIKKAWESLNREERFVFNKIITGSFRVGVSDKLITKAIARYLDRDPADIAHRMMGNWTPHDTNWVELFESEIDQMNSSKPYPFYLAYALDVSFDVLGDPHIWSAEYKWDGIRGQLIVRDGLVFIWSRGEDLITHQYPEFEELKDILPDGTVIDGELLAYDGENPLAFGQLQKRLGRKKVSKKLLESVPVVLKCYDLLEYQGADIRSEPLKKRRERLTHLVTEINHAKLLLSHSIDFDSWDSLTEIRHDARAMHSEGLMLKKWDSPYLVGRKRGDWWKWKVDPYTIDAVLLYAQRGHGRRANLYTDYTFAVWKGEDLVPIAKAYSGLTDKEFAQVDRWIKKNTLERFGPVRSVKPELVFEIHFEDINESSRHKSGIALRFPRMHRWRQDKPANEANTLEEGIQLLQLKKSHTKA